MTSYAQKIEQFHKDHQKMIEAHKHDDMQDQIDCLTGLISQEEYNHRKITRDTEIRQFDLDSQRQIELEKSKERSLKRQQREKRIQAIAVELRSGPLAMPIISGWMISWSQMAVIRKMIEVSEGEDNFEVAIGWLVKAAAVSRTTVKNTIKLMKHHKLIRVTERKRPNSHMNLYNHFQLLPGRFMDWFMAFSQYKRGTIEPEICDSDFFAQRGSIDKPHKDINNNNISTLATSTNNKIDNKCRQKAKRNEKRDADRDIETEIFEPVATAALDIIGEGSYDNISQHELVDEILKLKQQRQASYIDGYWAVGVKKHGIKRACLAFLETQIVDLMRKQPIPDNRPHHEKNKIRCKNKYLTGILKKDIHQCRPEITIAAVMKSKEIYDLPVKLISELNEYLLNKKETFPIKNGRPAY